MDLHHKDEVGKRARATLAALALACALVACAPHPDRDDPETLPVGRFGDATTLDPSHETNRTTLAVLSSVFETLILAQPGGTVQAVIAAAWHERADGRIWTIRLRPGLTFSDGAPLDARAVAGNFARWRSAAAAAPTYRLLLGRSVVSATAADPATVTIALRDRLPLLQILALPAFGIASVRAGASAAPVGSGPYTVAEWVPGDHLTLRANPRFAGRAPAFGTVIVRTIPDSPTGVLALQKHDVLALLDARPEDDGALRRQGGIAVDDDSPIPLAVSGVSAAEQGPQGEMRFERWTPTERGT